MRFWQKMPQQIKSTQIQQKKLRNKQGYNIVQLKTYLMDEGVLLNSQMEELINKFSSIIKNQPNLLQINGDVAIIGDIHGQYFDFLKILTQLGDLSKKPENNLLFLGDYVDRGPNSIEVMTLIMALKVNYPKNIYLLRGNHESRCMTTLYNFLQETTNKYNQDIYQRFMATFDNLPLACLVNNTIFCVHGGLSADLSKIQQINQINRFSEIPLEGAFCDFIWSDPINDQNGQINGLTTFNESRQCSIYFGKTLTKKFLQENSLKTIVRAHEVFPQGFKNHTWGLSKSADFPSIITIFSAPNYCGVYGNKGAILKIQNNTYKIKQYKQEPVHKLFKYLQVLQWSIPLITDVINEFTRAMISSIFHIYLRHDFENFHKVSTQTKIRFLLHYIETKTDIGKQINKKSHTAKKQGIVPPLSAKQEADEKERMFNRSQQYFQKQHQRPESKIIPNKKAQINNKGAKVQ